MASNHFIVHTNMLSTSHNKQRCVTVRFVNSEPEMIWKKAAVVWGYHIDIGLKILRKTTKKLSSWMVSGLIFETRSCRRQSRSAKRWTVLFVHPIVSNLPRYGKYRSSYISVYPNISTVCFHIPATSILHSVKLCKLR